MNAIADGTSDCEAGQCIRVKSGTQANVGDLRIGIMNCTTTMCRLSIAPTEVDARQIIFAARTGDKITIGNTKFTVISVAEDRVEFELRE